MCLFYSFIYMRVRLKFLVQYFYFCGCQMYSCFYNIVPDGKEKFPKI